MTQEFSPGAVWAAGLVGGSQSHAHIAIEAPDRYHVIFWGFAAEDSPRSYYGDPALIREKLATSADRVYVGNVNDMIRGLRALHGGCMTHKLIGVDALGCYVHEGDWLRDVKTGYVLRAKRFDNVHDEFLCDGGVYGIPDSRATRFVPGSLHVSEHDVCPYDREAYTVAVAQCVLDAAIEPSRRAADAPSDVFERMEDWL